MSSLVCAADATRAGDRIRSALLDSGSRFHADPSLATGHAGAALCFAELASRGVMSSGFEFASEHLERAFELVSRNGSVTGLFSGLAGVLWTASYLNRRFPQRFDVDVSDGFEVLLDVVSRWPADGSYVLTNGMAGVLIGFLACDSMPVRMQGVTAALAWLERRGSQLGGRPWRTTAHLLPDTLRNRVEAQSIDLGIAHGVAGVLASVMIAGAVGLQSSASVVIADQLVPILERNACVDETGAWSLPAMDVGRRGEGDQLAWCYGRLGLSVLQRHADSIGGELGARIQSATWVQPTRPTERLLGHIRDASLCHGAIGLELLLRWLNAPKSAMPTRMETDCARLVQSSLGWTLSSVPRFIVPDAHGAYAEYRPGLLEGEAGVLLGAWTVAADGSWDWTGWLALERTVAASSTSGHVHG